MWVVKLGGSLLDAPELPCWLDAIARYGAGKMAVVPGGGGFADQVRSAQRRWGFNDATAHCMALLAMQQYGLMLTGLCRDLETADCPEAAHRILATGGIAVWLPPVAQLDAAGIPATWEITSDTLAAWFAGKIHAKHLALVKSAQIPAGRQTVAQAVSDGIVDAAFAGMAEKGDFTVELFGRGDYSTLERAILNGHAAGRRMLTF